MVGLLSQPSWANNKHFKNAASNKSCGSIITTSGVTECTNVQQAKNTACNRETKCEPTKMADWKTDYEKIVTWLSSDEGKKTDNQYKRDQQNKAKELFELLKAGKAEGERGIPISQDCIKARDAVQNYFANNAVNLAKEVRDELIPMRRALVDKFNETKTKREDTKKKSEDNPKDDNLRREWEAARDANIEAGRKLDEFDRTYGPDMQYYFDQLISHYSSEKTNHDPISLGAEVRLQKCQTSAGVSWSSMP